MKVEIANDIELMKISKSRFDYYAGMLSSKSGCTSELADSLKLLAKNEANRILACQPTDFPIPYQEEARTIALSVKSRCKELGVEL